MKTCLLITTKDNRNFLTEETNLNSLIEFCKTFSSEIFKVKYTKGKILSLKSLAQYMCDQDYNEPMEVDKMKKIFPSKSKSRNSIIKNAEAIKNFIRSNLLSGKSMSLKDLKDKYKELGVTDACLCNHLANTRKMLSKEGHTFKKIGAGKYLLLK